MKYKADWPEARQRLTALWEGEVLDRPCVAVRAPSGRRAAGPGAPATAEQKWVDPDWVTRAAHAQLENTWWGGEAIPSVLVLAGWLVCFGAAPRFEMETIWWREMAFDFERASDPGFNPGDPWVKRFQTVYCAVAEFAGRDDFMVGHPCILPANDLLSMLMGAERFLVNLVDRPDWMREAVVRGARAQVAARNYFMQLIRPGHDYCYGNAGWMSFWAPEPYVTTQSDVSCMLSPEMFDRFVLPELEVLHEAFGPVWYHLDGGDARQHLNRLLSLPYLRVLQYTPAPFEPPNGPAHLAFYQAVQAAGKIVHINLPKQHVEPLLKALKPNLLMLDTTCASIEEGEALLEACGRWV